MGFNKENFWGSMLLILISTNQLFEITDPGLCSEHNPVINYLSLRLTKKTTTFSYWDQIFFNESFIWRQVPFLIKGLNMDVSGL